MPAPWTSTSNDVNKTGVRGIVRAFEPITPYSTAATSMGSTMRSSSVFRSQYYNSKHGDEMLLHSFSQIPTSSTKAAVRPLGLGTSCQSRSSESSSGGKVMIHSAFDKIVANVREPSRLKRRIEYSKATSDIPETSGIDMNSRSYANNSLLERRLSAAKLRISHLEAELARTRSEMAANRDKSETHLHQLIQQHRQQMRHAAEQAKAKDKQVGKLEHSLRQIQQQFLHRSKSGSQESTSANPAKCLKLVPPNMVPREDLERERNKLEFRIDDLVGQLKKLEEANAELIQSKAETIRKLKECEKQCERHRKTAEKITALTDENKKLNQHIKDLQSESLTLKQNQESLNELHNDLDRALDEAKKAIVDNERLKQSGLEYSKTIAALKHSSQEKDKRIELLLHRLKQMRRLRRGNDSVGDDDSRSLDYSDMSLSSNSLDTITENLPTDIPGTSSSHTHQATDLEDRYRRLSRKHLLLQRAFANLACSPTAKKNALEPPSTVLRAEKQKLRAQVKRLEAYVNEIENSKEELKQKLYEASEKNELLEFQMLEREHCELVQQLPSPTLSVPATICCDRSVSTSDDEGIFCIDDKQEDQDSVPLEDLKIRFRLLKHRQELKPEDKTVVSLVRRIWEKLTEEHAHCSQRIEELEQNLSSQVTSLRQQLQELQDENAELLKHEKRRRIKELRRQVSECKDAYASKEKENGDLADTVSIQKLEIEKLRYMIKANEEVEDRYKATVNDLSKELTNIRGSREAEVQLLQQTVDRTQKEAERLRQDSEAKTESLECENKRLSDTILKLQSKHCELQQELEQTRSVATVCVDPDAEAEREELQERVKLLQEKLEQGDTIKHQLSCKIEELETRCEGLEQVASEVRELRASRDESEGQLKDLKEQFSCCKEKLRDSRRLCGEFEESNSEIQDEVAKWKAKCSKYENEILHVRDECLRLQQELDLAHKEVMEKSDSSMVFKLEVEKAKVSAETKEEEWNRKVTELENEVVAAHEESKRISSMCRDLQKELIEERKIEAENKTRLKSLEDERIALTQEISMLTEKLCEHKKERDLMETERLGEISGLNSRLHDVTSEKDCAVRDIRDLKKQLEEQEALCKKQQDETCSLRNQINGLSAERDQVSSLLESVAIKLEEAAKCEVLNQARIDHFQHQVRESTESIQVLKANKQDDDDTIAQKSSEIEKLKTENDSLLIEVNQIRKQFEEAQARIGQYNENKSQLCRQLDIMNQQAKDLRLTLNERQKEMDERARCEAEASQQLHKHDSELEQLRREVQHQADVIEQRTALGANLQHQLEHCESDFETLQRDSLNLKSEMERMKQTEHELRQALRQAAVTASKERALEDKVQLLEGIVEKMEVDLKDKEEERNAIQKRLAQIKDFNLQLEKQFELQIMTSDLMKDKILKLQEELRTKESLISNKEEQYEGLASQYNCLCQKLAAEKTSHDEFNRAVSSEIAHLSSNLEGLRKSHREKEVENNALQSHLGSAHAVIEHVCGCSRSDQDENDWYICCALGLLPGNRQELESVTSLCGEWRKLEEQLLDVISKNDHSTSPDVQVLNACYRSLLAKVNNKLTYFANLSATLPSAKSSETYAEKESPTAVIIQAQRQSLSEMAKILGSVAAHSDHRLRLLECWNTDISKHIEQPCRRSHRLDDSGLHDTSMDDTYDQRYSYENSNNNTNPASTSETQVPSKLWIENVQAVQSISDPRESLLYRLISEVRSSVTDDNSQLSQIVQEVDAQMARTKNRQHESSPLHLSSTESEICDRLRQDSASPECQERSSDVASSPSSLSRHDHITVTSSSEDDGGWNSKSGSLPCPRNLKLIGQLDTATCLIGWEAPVNPSAISGYKIYSSKSLVQTISSAACTKAIVQCSGAGNNTFNDQYTIDVCSFHAISNMESYRLRLNISDAVCISTGNSGESAGGIIELKEAGMVKNAEQSSEA